jgi:hypothetical protein
VEANGDHYPATPAGIINIEADLIQKGGKWARGDSNPKLSLAQPLTDVNPANWNHARNVILLVVESFNN